MAADPWTQRPDEPPESFVRFQFYLQLGPARSLTLAYMSYCQSLPGAKKRARTQPAPGNWTEDSSRFDWPARATAFDIRHLQERGGELVVMWNELICQAVRKALERITSARCSPKTYRECLAAISAGAPFLTPELLASFTARQQREPEPPDSCPLDFRPIPEDAP